MFLTMYTLLTWFRRSLMKINDESQKNFDAIVQNAKITCDKLYEEAYENQYKFILFTADWADLQPTMTGAQLSSELREWVASSKAKSGTNASL